MKVKINHSYLPLMVMLLFVSIFWIETGYSFEPWKGETTFNVNLRQSPEDYGKVLTGIKKGTKLLVVDEKNGWYQVVINRGRYRYEGWIFGKFINIQEQKLEDKTEEINIETDSAAIPIEEPATDFTKAPIEENRTEPQKVPQKNIPLHKTITPLMEENSSYLQAADIEEKEEESTEQKELSTIVNNKDNINYKGVLLLFQLLLKVSTVILSCIALALSYKAYKLATKSQNMVKQLQDKENKQNTIST